MSSDRIPRRAALLGLMALGGCGFAPVYGSGTGLRGLVAFQTDETVAGFRMRDQLERRLGPPEQPLYLLEVTQSDRRRPAAITSDGDTVRFNVIGAATWTLRDVSNNRPVATGDVESFTSYAATGSTVATQAAATDAVARLSTALADLIMSRLLVLSADLTP